jgi:hypothetical protein
VLLHPPDQLLFDTNTQFNLGVKYAFGKGVLKDDKQAVYWYQKAADIPLISCFLIPIRGLLIVF